MAQLIEHYSAASIGVGPLTRAKCGMGIAITSLNEANAPAARVLLLQYWNRNWSDIFAEKFFTWRYMERRFRDTLLAIDRGRCVAILDSFLRTYLLAGRPTAVRETCDWFCLPEYRKLGMGLSLMRRMMAKAEPIIVIGGTEATKSLLPRLKWQQLPDVPNYFLPISSRALAAFGLRRLRAGAEVFARALPNLTIRRPRPIPPPSQSAELLVSSDGRVPLPVPLNSYALVSMIDEATLRWLARAPREVGDLVTLEFMMDGELVGISTSRLERRKEGLSAKVLHLQSTLHSRQHVIDWMVGETARQLATRRAEFISCRASCPTIRMALRRTGFLAGPPLSAFWWSAQGVAPRGPMHLTRIVGDDSIEFIVD